MVVRIADDGPGIPADLREHYLGEGVRGPDSAGTGFGLYLASTLVEAYGGRFHLGDNDPTGALVELRLRAADSGTRPVAETLH